MVRGSWFVVPSSARSVPSSPLQLLVHHEEHEEHEEIPFFARHALSPPPSAFRDLSCLFPLARSLVLAQGLPACEHSQAGAKAPKTDLITNDTNPPNFANTA